MEKRKEKSIKKEQIPIQAEYFLSGGQIILTFIVDGAKLTISFSILSARPGYIEDPPKEEKKIKKGKKNKEKKTKGKKIKERDGSQNFLFLSLSSFSS